MQSFDCVVGFFTASDLQLSLEQVMLLLLSSIGVAASVIFFLHTMVCVKLTAFMLLMVTFYTYGIHFYRNMVGLPPGPLPLPILGNLHQLGIMAHENLQQLSKKYGDVMRILVGTDVVYVVSGIDAALEGLVTKSADFSGRPLTYTLSLTTGGKGIAP